jgi:hypothetical protein
MADGIVEYILRLDDRTKAGTASATAGSRKLEAQTEATTRAVDDLGDETAQTGRQLTTMGRQSQTAGQGVGRFGGVLGGLKTRLAGVSASSVAFGATLGATALLGTVTAATAGLASMAQGVADLRNDLADASTRSGIAVETLQGLRLAAEGSGLSFSALTSGLDQFGARLSQAAEGTGRTAEAFAALGVEVVDAGGNLRDGDAVLRETLAALNAMEPSAERSALAVEALGRTGGKLLQALSGTELGAFVEQARIFGVDVGPEAAKSAGEWQRATAELDLVTRGLKGAIVDAFGGGADALFTFTEAVVVVSTRYRTFAEEAPRLFDLVVSSVESLGDVLGAQLDRILARAEAIGVVIGAVAAEIGSVAQTLGDALAAGDLAGFVQAARGIGEAVADGLADGLETAGARITAADRAFAQAARNRDQTIAATAEAFASTDRAATQRAAEQLLSLRQTRGQIVASGVQRQGPGGAGGSTPEAEAAAGEASAEAAARVFASGFQEERRALSDVLAEGAANLAEQQAKTAAMAAETRAGRLEAAQTAIGVTGQALSGDLGGALSSAGGAAGLAGLGVAGAAVSGLQFIGEQGAQGISDTLDGLKAALLGALEALPELIGDVLPRFAVSLVADLIPALIRAAPQIFYSLVVELPKAIGQAIVDALSFDTDKLTKRVERSEFLQNVVAVGSFFNPFATEAEKEARRAELTDRGDQSEVLGQRSRSASRTATDGQMGTARESDRLAMMSTRPRMTRATVKSNPFDDLARQYDVQYGEYGRARSTTIRPAAT